MGSDETAKRESRGSSDRLRSDPKRDGGDPHRSLVERIQREVPYGTTAFQQMVEELGPTVYARARRILGSREDADDALQEVFLRVFRSVFEFRFDRPFVHWLQVITLNTCRHTLRTRRREARRREAFKREPRRNTALEESRDPMLRGYLVGLLDALQPDTRICLVLRLLEDRSYAEIAQELGVKEAAVRKRVQRGTERLRGLFDERVTRGVTDD